MLGDALVSSGVVQTVRTGMAGVVAIAAEGTRSTSKGREMKGEEKGREMAACLLFFTTSTRYYLYTSLLLVLGPPKSSELTASIVRLVCTKSELLRKVLGCSAPLNSLSGCNRGLA